MLLGILVALIKIAQLATVDPGVGLFAMGLLAVLLPAISVTFDAREIWKRVEWKHGDELAAAAFADENCWERGR